MQKTSSNNQKQETQSIPEIWWYTPVIHTIIENLRPASERMKVFKNPPATKDDFIEKGAISKIELIAATMHSFKLFSACIELDDFEAENILRNELSNLFPKTPIFDWIHDWQSNFGRNISFAGFDKEILWPSSRAAENSNSPQAIEFRAKRGFKWKWKTHTSRIDQAR